MEQRREELVALRGRWEAKANEHLERAGQRERIDMRSYTA
ncbi:MobA/MobL family protein, partial [Salmonella enterica]